nr:reverse transcriptase domain-containing protein [Tanacetum cinerariifolium]
MDDEPTWVADRVVAPTLGFAITILETANEFAIKEKVLLKLDWAKNQKTKPSLKKTVAFVDEGSSNSDTDKIMARIDAMTMKMDAQYKEFQSCSKQPNPDHNDDDKPMFLNLEANFMQTFHRTRFYNDYRYRDSNRDNWRSSGRNDYNRDNYRSNSDDKLDLQKQLRRTFLHTTDAVIRVKQKQLNLGVGTKRMTFSIDSAMKHSYSNNDTCFSIDVIDEILEEDFDTLLNEGSKILHFIEGTILEEKLFCEIDEFMAMSINENSESEPDTEEPPIEKITFNIDYKINTSLEEPPSDLELKPLPDNLEYVLLEKPSFLHVIISSQISK